MSVLTCNRRGCSNVMCDRYSQKYGYICNKCFEQLVPLTKRLNPDYLDETIAAFFNRVADHDEYDDYDLREQLETEFYQAGEIY